MLSPQSRSRGGSFAMSGRPPLQADRPPAADHGAPYPSPWVASAFGPPGAGVRPTQETSPREFPQKGELLLLPERRLAETLDLPDEALYTLADLLAREVQRRVAGDRG